MAGTGGYISIGFYPKSIGDMGGTTAAVTVGSSLQYYRMDGEKRNTFSQISLSGLPLPVAAASMSVVGGKTILRHSGVGFTDVRAVPLNYGQARCAWPCSHGSGSDDRGGLTINLITGEVVTQDNLRLAAVLGGYAGLVAVAAGSVAARCYAVSRKEKFGWPFVPRCWGWSPSGIVAVLAALLVLVVIAAVTRSPGSASDQSDDASDTAAVFSTGRAAGLALSLPLCFALTKVSLGTLLCIPKEVVWQVHSVMGFLFLVFGTAHGVVALTSLGFEAIFEDGGQLLGFVAMVLIWASILPMFVHSFRPGRGFYDVFKLLHYLAVPGYAISCAHMIGVESKILAAVSIILGVVYLLQKVYVRCTAGRFAVEGAELIADEGGRHVVLDLAAPQFEYRAGQWALLGVPRAGLVAHPFTLVPGENQGQVRIIAKVSGPFTSKLADLSPTLKGGQVTLEGPYGRPALAAQAWARAVVFVVGGVGVTPALALAATARASKMQVRFYWALRSPALLHACSPCLERNVPPEHRCVSLTAGAGAAAQVGKPTAAFTGEAKALPLQASAGRRDVAAWLRSVGAELKAAGHSEVLVFVCGPPGLAAAAKRTAQEPSSVSMVVHEEVFNFLPTMRCGRMG